MMSPEKEKIASSAGNDLAGNDVGTNLAALVSAGLVLSRLGRQSERALSPLQLTLTQYRILAYLAGGSSVSSTLAGALQVTPPSVTGVVDGLVARGLVTRRPDANDLRRQHVNMTNAGVRILAEAEEVVARVLADILSYLEPSEVATVMEAFQLCELALDRRFQHSWPASVVRS
jgi:DNA-binding MarR family transcriptional regulator